MNSQSNALLTSTGFLLDEQLQNLSIELIGSQIKVGRSPDNDICIDNRRLSQHHARLSCICGQWQIEDLESANSVFVNQEKIFAPRALKYGDLVSFGGVEFLFDLKKKPLVLRQDILTNVTKEVDFQPDATIHIDHAGQLNLRIKQKYSLFYRFLYLSRSSKLVVFILLIIFLLMAAYFIGRIQL